MAEYKPSLPFFTPLKLYVPAYEVVSGVRKKVYPAEEADYKNDAVKKLFDRYKVNVEVK